MTPTLSLALCLVGSLIAMIGGGVLWVLTGMRDEMRALREELGALARRVGEHDSFIAALKIKEKLED